MSPVQYVKKSGVTSYVPCLRVHGYMYHDINFIFNKYNMYFKLSSTKFYDKNERIILEIRKKMR